MNLLLQIQKLPELFQKNMVISIPVAMFLGFLLGLLFEVSWLQVLILPFTFLMVYPPLVGTNLKQVLSGDDTRLQIATQAINFIVIPFIAWILGFIFFRDFPMLRLGLFLTALLPTSGMTLNWTNFTKGNLPSAVKMTVVGLVAGSLLTPFYIKAVFGQTIPIPLTKMLAQITAVVFIPLLLGQVTQHILVKKFGKQRFAEKIKPAIAPWGIIGVLGVQFAAMAIKAKTLLVDPFLLVRLGIPIFIFFLVNFILSTLLARLFKNRADGIAFIYGTALRNLSIALAIAMTVFGKKGGDIALLVSFGFIFQAQMAAWHARTINKLLP